MKILILGGTTEASQLAAALACDARFEPSLSYAGRTSAPRTPPIPHRIGGFGGVEGLIAFLTTGGFHALIDATHPFAARISAHAQAAAEAIGLPLVAVIRPPWTPGPGDFWRRCADMQAAADAIGEVPRRVMLTVGRLELSPFRGAPQHSYVLRSIDAPDPALLPPVCEIVTARGPFDVAGERALLEQHDIDVLVTKNSGGDATAAKLAAARDLRIPVLMVERPPRIFEGDVVADAAGAVAWLERLHATMGRPAVPSVPRV